MDKYGVVDEFANKTVEVHAIFWGAIKGIHPGRGRFEYKDEPNKVQKEIEHEWHYYTLGYYCGRVLLLIGILVANKLGLNLDNLTGLM